MQQPNTLTWREMTLTGIILSVFAVLIWHLVNFPAYSVILAALIFSSIVLLASKNETVVAIFSFFGILFMILPITLLSVFASNALVQSSRIASVLFVVVAYALLRKRRENLTNNAMLVPLTYIPVIVFVAASSLPHYQWIDFIVYGFGGGVFALSLFILLRDLHDGHFLLYSMYYALLIASLLLALFLPNISIESGRVRGIFENANGFGFVCFAAGSFATYLKGKKLPRMFLFGLSIVGILVSASRASMLALSIVVIVYLFRTRTITTILFFFTTSLILLIFPQLIAGKFLKEGILRDNNSRSEGAAVALTDWNSHFWFGVGFGNESDIIASTPYRALSNAGILGGVVVLVLYVLLIAACLRGAKNLLPFVLAAIVHSFFEGWFLSSLSPLLVIFLTTYVVLSNQHGTHQPTSLRS